MNEYLKQVLEEDAAIEQAKAQAWERRKAQIGYLLTPISSLYHTTIAFAKQIPDLIGKGETAGVIGGALITGGPIGAVAGALAVKAGKATPKGIDNMINAGIAVARAGEYEELVDDAEYISESDPDNPRLAKVKNLLGKIGQIAINSGRHVKLEEKATSEGLTIEQYCTKQQTEQEKARRMSNLKRTRTELARIRFSVYYGDTNPRTTMPDGRTVREYYDSLLQDLYVLETDLDDLHPENYIPL